MHGSKPFSSCGTPAFRFLSAGRSVSRLAGKAAPRKGSRGRAAKKQRGRTACAGRPCSPEVKLAPVPVKRSAAVQGADQENAAPPFETRFRDAILRIAPQPLLRMKRGKVVGTTLFFILRRPLRRREAPSRNGRHEGRPSRRTPASKDAGLEGRRRGRIGRACAGPAPACARRAIALLSALPSVPPHRLPRTPESNRPAVRKPQARAWAGGCGEVPEWSNGAVSKTVVRFAYRGFESHPLRQLHSKPLR